MTDLKRERIAVDQLRIESFQDVDLEEYARCIGQSWEELCDEMQDHKERLADIRSRMATLRETELSHVEIVRNLFGDERLGQGFLVVARPPNSSPGDPIAGCIGAFKKDLFELELVRLYVDKPYRGCGLGRVLVERVVDYAKIHGYERIILKCGSASGQTLYRKCGFRAIDTYYFWKTVPNTRKLDRVAILGGTHGNELVGPHLVSEVWGNNGNHLDLANASGGMFNVELHITNPEATRRCVRFVDRDINRCFELAELEKPLETEAEKLETKRAAEINRLLGPKTSILGSIASWKSQYPKAADYLIDLHGTTSNMGICLITLSGDVLTLRMALKVKEALEKAENMPRFNLLVDDFNREKYNNIDSLTPSGLCIEVGPQAHGTLNNLSLLKGTCMAVLEILTEIKRFNQRDHSKAVESDSVLEGTKIDGFVLWKPLHFPKTSPDATTVSAAIDPKLIGGDFGIELKKGDSVFVNLVTGETVVYYEETEPAFACFIGEAAYFTSGIAMWLCKKQSFMVYG